MTEYIVQWSRKGDSVYDPLSYARVEGTTKANALSKAKREIRKHTVIDIIMILTMKEYGEHMSERLATIE